MDKKYFVPLFRLYSINEVRKIRLELDISGRKLSAAKNTTKHSSLVGTVEGMLNESCYTENDLNIFAIKFTRKAKEMQKELDEDPENTLILKSEYTVHDLLSPESLEDKRVEKIIIAVPPGTGPSGTLNYLLKTDPWFNDDHTVREITDYCNAYKGENWVPSNFSGLCFRLWKKSRLIRTEIGNDDILYRNSKPLEV